MHFEFEPGNVIGLSSEDREQLRELWTIFCRNKSKNDLKEQYYDGRIPLASVNIGIALPENVARLEIDCGWGAKAVDVLAARSLFDGFVGLTGEDAEEANRIAEENNLIGEYRRVAVDELKFGCVFATLSRQGSGCKIRFHSPKSAAAKWNGEENRIGSGFAIIATESSGVDDCSCRPSIINYYTDTHIWVIRRGKDAWRAEGHRHKMGRPLMEPLIWNATGFKPFGRSRLDSPVRRLMDSYVRTLANASIGLEFATSPQKYILGVTDEQYSEIVDSKLKQYVGNILAATSNPDTGDNPEYGQLPQGTIQPHVEMLRLLATQFSAITGLSVMDTGVVNDANPTSHDAIEAQTKSLCELAERLNTENAAHLKTIVLMAMAVSRNVSLTELPQDAKNIMARFRDPSTPSRAAVADAAHKIAAVRPAFAETDVFLEMLNFDAATIRRINGQERRSRGRKTLEEEFGL